jgi:hypothetical protein
MNLLTRSLIFNHVMQVGEVYLTLRRGIFNLNGTDFHLVRFIFPIEGPGAAFHSLCCPWNCVLLRKRGRLA